MADLTCVSWFCDMRNPGAHALVGAISRFLVVALEMFVLGGFGRDISGGGVG